MNSTSLSQPGWFKRSGFFLLFFIGAVMVFAIMSLSSTVSTDTLLPYQAALTATLLAVVLILRRSERGNLYWPVCYVIFVAAAAVLLSGLFAGDLIRLVGFSVSTPQGIAVAKFSESILRVVPILALMPMMGFKTGVQCISTKEGSILGFPLVLLPLSAFPCFPISPCPTRKAY
jgi:hypothetical protein